MYRLQMEKNMNVFFHVALVLGLACSILHLSEFLFDMTLSVMFYEKGNIPSIFYIICHLLVIYIPLLLITPNGKLPKAKILKWTFYGISICYLLGNTWVLYYVFENSFSGLFTDTLENLRTFQRDNALMFNYLTWECYSPINVIFNLVQAFIFFILGRTIENDSFIFSLVAIAAVLFAVFTPILYNLIAGLDMDNEWFSKNVFILASQFMWTFSLAGISWSPGLWRRFLWTIAYK